MFDDRESFDQLTKTQAASKRAERKLYLYQIRQAAVSTTELTGHECWDTFLHQIQGMIEQEEKQVQHWQQALYDPNTSWASGPLAFTKGQLVTAQARLDTLKLVLAMPKQLIEAGQQAKNELDQDARPS